MTDEIRSQEFAHQESGKERGWVKETARHAAALTEFVQNLRTGEKGYDSINELHFSGQDAGAQQALANGEPFDKVMTLYDQTGRINQIHGDIKRTGHGLDVYLRGQALSDYLQSLDNFN